MSKEGEEEYYSDYIGDCDYTGTAHYKCGACGDSYSNATGCWTHYFMRHDERILIEEVRQWKVGVDADGNSVTDDDDTPSSSQATSSSSSDTAGILLKDSQGTETEMETGNESPCHCADCRGADFGGDLFKTGMPLWWNGVVTHCPSCNAVCEDIQISLCDQCGHVFIYETPKPPKLAMSLPSSALVAVPSNNNSDCKAGGRPRPKSKSKVILTLKKSRGNNVKKRLQCPHCCQCFGSSVFFYERHQRLVHKELTYPCEYCGGKFAEERHVTRHIRLYHREHKTNGQAGKHHSPCQVVTPHPKTASNERLTTNSRLTARKSTSPISSILESRKTTAAKLPPHVVRSRSRPNLKCEDCCETFPTTRRWKRHGWSHQDISSKMYKCEFCKGLFNSYMNFFNHKKRAHGNEESKNSPQTFPQDSPPSPSPPPPLKAKKKIRFILRVPMRNNMPHTSSVKKYKKFPLGRRRIHVNNSPEGRKQCVEEQKSEKEKDEANLQCPQSPRLFRLQPDLKKHLKRHKFQCKHCRNIFTADKYLDLHLKNCKGVETVGRTGKVSPTIKDMKTDDERLKETLKLAAKNIKVPSQQGYITPKMQPWVQLRRPMPTA